MLNFYVGLSAYNFHFVYLYGIVVDLLRLFDPLHRLKINSGFLSFELVLALCLHVSGMLYLLLHKVVYKNYHKY